ncbi:MAG TPA: hypothetical protein ENN80_04385 [Candidatus Hydrogenedentes bacterium]|nr:hypothetical protein [Candidatus Hydrogenedentota bacterium]
MNAKLSRREFVASSTALTVAAAMQKTHAEEVMPEQPNVLVIHLDQQRIDCLGAYGNPDIRTPNVDSLAADGVRFEHSFCPYPVCTPSRYSLLCGQYVHEHRGWTNHSTLPPGTATFASILRKAGYNTKAVGKMHFTPTYLDVGFSEMVLSEQNGPGRWDDDYHRTLRAEGVVDYNDLEDQEHYFRKDARDEYWETFGALPSNLPRAMHSTQWAGDRAIETLEGWDASGNLLMVGFIKPHHPFDPPPDMADAYDPEKLMVLPGWTDTVPEHDFALSKGYFPNDKLSIPAIQRAMAYYYATIEHIDQQIGRMTELLKRKGLYDDAMIVFTGDHGEYMGFHHMLLKGNHMYDPLSKVPLIIKYPKSAQRGTVSDALVCNLDVAPTILRQAGCTPGDHMHGLDLATHPEGREHVFSESRRGHEAMVRTKHRKLLLDPKRNETLLYDLEKDPHELTDRSEDPAYADELAVLTAAITEWRPFDNLPDTCLDEEAPVIDQPNVPDRHDGHREQMMAYCRAKMKQA